MGLWFETPDTETLCRGGGNGPNHPSQLYAVHKYIDRKNYPNTFLDYGCGSGTTYEKLKADGYFDIPLINYTGVDIIPKNIKWCRKQWPEANWEVNPSLHKIDQPDKSWDVVYSRHVVDHMKSFEDALDEHCRVAKKLVIIVLWRPLGTGDEHEIKNIVDGGKVYKDEYTNDYSRKLVKKALEAKDGVWNWSIEEGVGKEVKGYDTVIVMERNES